MRARRRAHPSGLRLAGPGLDESRRHTEVGHRVVVVIVLDADGTATLDWETGISGPEGADLRATVTHVLAGCSTHQVALIPDRRDGR
ncbi:hypothetical protein K3U95_17210 [Mycolicibacterium senegalense]|uniref:hypothetical protein n=1 Tax=Mycolicibacterium senegalense TaxID=1796 RepID=UPI001C99B775|nr:hypothetical protein [Mycolicibacterium senegalense]QZA22485.1 hypothetical protein K3U95_17210 [Mycolicibacterium senegalense]